MSHDTVRRAALDVIGEAVAGTAVGPVTLLNALEAAGVIAEEMPDRMPAGQVRLHPEGETVAIRATDKAGHPFPWHVIDVSGAHTTAGDDEVSEWDVLLADEAHEDYDDLVAAHDRLTARCFALQAQLDEARQLVSDLAAAPPLPKGHVLIDMRGYSTRFLRKAATNPSSAFSAAAAAALADRDAADNQPGAGESS